MPVNVPMASTGNVLTAIGANSIVSGLVAGAVGGLIGFLIAENLDNPANVHVTTSAGLDASSGLEILIFAAGLGFVLMGWEGFTSRSVQKTFRDGGIGAVIGAGSGFIGGFIAQWLYTKLLGNNFSGISDSKLILTRAIAWAIFGGLLGTGLGFKGGSKKLVNGLIGGVVGGAVGGLLFQLIGDSSSGSDGFVTRMFGFTITGIGIGLAIGLVERVRRDSWIQITAGPMAGKEFILYNAQTRIGRDYRNDIVMAKDALVAPFHAIFVRDEAGRVAVHPDAGASIAVNGLPSAGSQLRNADVVTVGGSAFTYQERAAT
jgi:hypothetical protein